MGDGDVPPPRETFTRRRSRVSSSSAWVADASCENVSMMHAADSVGWETHIHIAVLVETRKSLKRGFDVLRRDVAHFLGLEDAD